MRKLHLVGFTSDRKGLIFSARRGSKSGGFVVALEDGLIDTITAAQRRAEGGDEIGVDDPAPGSDRRHRPESTLTPREMQARLRAGRSITEVAREAQVDTEWVQRFAVPILAEQAQMVEMARALTFHKPRRGPSAEPLGPSVAENLIDRGVVLMDDAFDAAWTANQLHDVVWAVRLRYRSRGREQEAIWEVNVASGQVTSRNRLASALGFVDERQRRASPRQPASADAEAPEPEKARRRAAAPVVAPPAPRTRRPRRPSAAAARPSAPRASGRRAGGSTAKAVRTGTDTGKPTSTTKARRATAPGTTTRPAKVARSAQATRTAQATKAATATKAAKTTKAATATRARSGRPTAGGRKRPAKSATPPATRNTPSASPGGARDTTATPGRRRRAGTAKRTGKDASGAVASARPASTGVAAPPPGSGSRPRRAPSGSGRKAPSARAVATGAGTAAGAREVPVRDGAPAVGAPRMRIGTNGSPGSVGATVGNGSSGRGRSSEGDTTAVAQPSRQPINRLATTRVAASRAAAGRLSGARRAANPVPSQVVDRPEPLRRAPVPAVAEARSRSVGEPRQREEPMAIPPPAPPPTPARPPVIDGDRTAGRGAGDPAEPADLLRIDDLLESVDFDDPVGPRSASARSRVSGRRESGTALSGPTVTRIPRPLSAWPMGAG